MFSLLKINYMTGETLDRDPLPPQPSQEKKQRQPPYPPGPPETRNEKREGGGVTPPPAKKRDRRGAPAHRAGAPGRGCGMNKFNEIQ